MIFEFMRILKADPIKIDPQLHSRLGALAKHRGASVANLAESVLRSYVDEAERAISEQADDEQRWQRYLKTGASVSFETVRATLRNLAAEASHKADPQ